MKYYFSFHIPTYTNTFQHIPTHINDYQHMLTHTNTCQHIPTQHNTYQQMSETDDTDILVMFISLEKSFGRSLLFYRREGES